MQRLEKVNNLKEAWTNVTKNMENIMQRNLLQESVGDLFVEDKENHEPFIVEIAECVSNLNNYLNKLKEYQQKRQRKAENKDDPSSKKPKTSQESKTFFFSSLF